MISVSLLKCCRCHTNVGFYIVVVFRQAHVVKRAIVYISAVTKFVNVVIVGRFFGFSFSQYAFVMSRYDALYIIHTAIANFDRVSVENLMKG